MLAQLLHRDSGKSYLVPTVQLVVYNDSGQPVAICYQRDGLIVFTDAAQSDFSSTIGELKINNIVLDA
jgi:hypothetical protein